jgi:hypothetical protein
MTGCLYRPIGNDEVENSCHLVMSRCHGTMFVSDTADDQLTTLPLCENRAHSQVLQLTSVILATREAEIRRIVVPGQPRQKVHEFF